MPPLDRRAILDLTNLEGRRLKKLLAPPVFILSAAVLFGSFLPFVSLNPLNSSDPDVANQVTPVIDCDQLEFIADVTVPDGSPVPPGASFLKVWRISNTGTCTWTGGYALVFVAGEQMGAAGKVNLPGNVLPGETIDLQVTMTAPSTPGIFTGFWALENTSGKVFGFCGNGRSSPFFVEISVSTPAQPPGSLPPNPPDLGSCQVLPPTQTATASMTATVTTTSTTTPEAAAVRTPVPSETIVQVVGSPTVEVAPAPGSSGPNGPAEVLPYREAGPLVPELTTNIPTPLDISTAPGVVGTNLLLAAILMLPFTLAAEAFTRILREKEESLQRWIPPIAWLARLQVKLTQVVRRPLKRRSQLLDALGILGVMAFYGLVFSLLDRSWKPLSLQGLTLFLSMMVAYGLVGVADDIAQWRRLRKWGNQADLKVRPSGVLLAIVSTLVTRLFAIVPGLMFGTPEALQADTQTLSPARRDHLTRVSAASFLLIGAGAWLPTVVTGLALRGSLPEVGRGVVEGIQAFLLVVFAVALENLFVQVLGFLEGIGQFLRRKSRLLWLGSVVAVSFLFIHTLINPRGELSAALDNGNVLFFIFITGGFTIGVGILQLVLRRRARVINSPGKEIE